MNNNTKTLDDLKALIRTVIDAGSGVSITEHSRLKEDLGMNSFHFMALLYLLEEEWGTKPETEKLSGITDVSGLYTLLCGGEKNEKIQ